MPGPQKVGRANRGAQAKTPNSKLPAGLLDKRLTVKKAVLSINLGQ